MSIFIKSSHALPPCTEEIVKAIAICLLGAGSEITILPNALTTHEQEVKNYINVLKWLYVDSEIYHVSGNENVIVFVNGSKIIFK